MLRPTRKNARGISLATTIARVVVSVCLALSFFASVVPLNTSASAGAGAMDCCVGKPGHCHSGLIVKRRARRKPKLEPMCGLKPAAQSDESEVLTGDEIVAAEATTDSITIVAVSSEQENDQTASSAQVFTKTSSRAVTTPVVSAKITKPCPADCRASIAGVVRQPRPREAALLVNGSRRTLPRPANRNPYSSDNSLAASAILKRTRPRGPPRSS